MRRQLFNIIEPSGNLAIVEKIYDVFMVCTIVVSLLPLTSKTTTSFYIMSDVITMIIFIIDYFPRFITTDYKLSQGKLSFVEYSFTLLVVTDLIATLSSIPFWNNTFKLLKIIRMVRTIHVFKLFRHPRSLNLLTSILKRQKGLLPIVGTLVITYIFISVLVTFNTKPDTFKNFFNALYWLAIFLIAVGYGDTYAISGIEKLIIMISFILDVVIITLPVNIMTTGYLEEIEKEDTKPK